MKRLILTLLVAVTALGAAAQEYWLPSADLVEKARQDPVVQKYIKCFRDRQKSFDEVKVLNCEIRGEEIYIYHKIRQRGRYTWTTGSYYGGYTIHTETDYTYQPDNEAESYKRDYSALGLTEHQIGKVIDVWFTWLYYITGYTFRDEWVFSRSKKVNGTVLTTQKDIADLLIKTYHLPDLSRKSQIALLSKNIYDRNILENFSRSPFPVSRYSDVISVSEKGIEVYAAVRERTKYDTIEHNGAEAVAYVYADDPLAVVAARTLGIPLLVRIYDLTRPGVKVSFTIKPESL